MQETLVQLKRLKKLGREYRREEDKLERERERLEIERERRHMQSQVSNKHPTSVKSNMQLITTHGKGN